MRCIVEKEPGTEEQRNKGTEVQRNRGLLIGEYFKNQISFVPWYDRRMPGGVGGQRREPLPARLENAMA